MLVLLACLVAGAADYYKVLGIKRTATEKEIKKAYRKLSVKVKIPALIQDEMTGLIRVLTTTNPLIVPSR